MKIPKSFLPHSSPEGRPACQTFRRDACRVLRRFACDMALRSRDFTIRSHSHRVRAVDVFALQTDSLLVEIQHSAGAGGVQMSYRTCQGRGDRAGGRCNAVNVQSLGTDQGYANLLSTFRVVAGRRR